jgi:hypothetical protein
VDPTEVAASPAVEKGRRSARRPAGGPSGARPTGPAARLRCWLRTARHGADRPRLAGRDARGLADVGRWSELMPKRRIGEAGASIPAPVRTHEEPFWAGITASIAALPWRVQ